MSCFLFGYLGLNGQEKLEIEGAIKIGNSEEVFPGPGTIQWTGSDFQVWNGYMWVSMLSGIAYTGEVTDVEGNVYPTIVIGDQEWMAENLRTGKYRNGNSIPQIQGNTDWSNAVAGAWCWYDNNSVYDRPFGKLYNWYAVNDGRGLCPIGWDIPTNAEWTALTDFLGGLDNAGGPMKESGSAHWNSPNTGATNASGFTGLPGGGRVSLSSFSNLGNFGYLWSNTFESSSNAWFRFLSFSTDRIDLGNLDKWFGFSVRCIKD